MKYSSVFLLGFRATGKSTLGKYLAKTLDWELYEMDRLIIERANKSVDELTEGGTNWKKFREIEHQILEELIDKKNIVVSSGGGVGVNDQMKDENSKTLKSNKEALVVVLDTDERTIKKRIESLERRKSDTHRPLLDEQKAKEVQNISDRNILIKAIVEDSLKSYRLRKPLYEALADLSLDTSKLSKRQCVASILHSLGFIVSTSIGYPVKHSLSPTIHASGYKALKIDDKYKYLSIEVKDYELREYIEWARKNLKGISCTMPHKQEVMKYLDEVDEVAQKIGAVNTIVNKEGKLSGFNTDYIGVLDSLKELTSLQDKKVVILGAGGASRAVVYALVSKGASVVICNRTVKRAKELALDFGCEFSGFDNKNIIQNADIIINATSVGMNEDKSPIEDSLISQDQVVFDLVYYPTETKLLRIAKARGAKTISGIEMLLNQAFAQFKLYTGYDAPKDQIRKKVMEKINAD